ncbi:MAG: hypothetical protein VXW32_06535 [Myxococcota bacterium]|nr:hypothetical protein [Myxococcota bacterium]
MLPAMMASLLTLSLFAPLGVDPGPTKIDRIVAVVNDTIVTEAELRIEAQLLEFDPIEPPPLRAPQPDILRLLEDRRVLEQLAASRPLYVPSESEVVARRQQLIANLGERSTMFMETWGFTEESLDRFLERRMTAERYLTRNLGRSLRAEIAVDSPEWELTYRQKYVGWIAERRDQLSIRRVGTRSQ